MSGAQMVHAQVADVLAATGRWTRHEARRRAGPVEWAGAPVGAERVVAISTSPARLSASGALWDVTAHCAPVIVADKPAGVEVTRRSESGAPTLFAWIGAPLGGAVEAVGRLDRETSGLIVLSGDGALVQRLTHPKRRTPRSYEATLDRPPDQAAVERARAGGLALRDGHVPRPTALSPLDETTWRVGLIEGKYHEVRRLFAACGARVIGLRRTEFGGFSLGDLRGAPWRRLDEAEVVALYARVGLGDPPLRITCVEVPDGRAEG